MKPNTILVSTLCVSILFIVVWLIKRLQKDLETCGRVLRKKDLIPRWKEELQGLLGHADTNRELHLAVASFVNKCDGFEHTLSTQPNHWAPLEEILDELSEEKERLLKNMRNYYEKVKRVRQELPTLIAEVRLKLEADESKISQSKHPAVREQMKRARESFMKAEELYKGDKTEPVNLLIVFDLVEDAAGHCDLALGHLGMPVPEPAR